jgi:ATP-dependent Clp protease adaptor protein ClpS
MYFHFICVLLLCVVFFDGLERGDAFLARSIKPSSLMKSRCTPLGSTIIAPPKVDKTTKKDTKSPTGEPSIPGFIFKESRDVQKEFEEYTGEKKYLVILYNDPYNKRQYVQQVLIEIFSFSEEVANATMMQAHTYGFAVVGEWAKDVAIEYVKKLLAKNLVAEAKPADDDN